MYGSPDGLHRSESRGGVGPPDVLPTQLQRESHWPHGHRASTRGPVTAANACPAADPGDRHRDSDSRLEAVAGGGEGERRSSRTVRAGPWTNVLPDQQAVALVAWMSAWLLA